MEHHRTFHRIEDLIHPVTGGVIIRNALWQVYETSTLVGEANLDRDAPISPTIINSISTTIHAPNHISPAQSAGQQLSLNQYTFFCPKYGMGTIITLPILPITTKLALDSNGLLRLTKDHKEPTLHVAAPAPPNHLWAYTVFHSTNFAPRLELYATSNVDGRTALVTPYPAYLPNCSNDGTTCIGNTRETTDAFKGLILPIEVVKEILFAQFNNDLFPNQSSVHTWAFPAKGNNHPYHKLANTFYNHTLPGIWPSVLL